MTSTARFDMDADTLDGVRRYFHARAVQGLMEGYRWEGAVEALDADGAVWGARTWSVDPDGVRRQSVYVLHSRRGQGHLSRYVARADAPFVTAPDCDLERFFQSRGVPYRLAGAFATTREYRAVESFFGDRHAARSGLHYMNHIDEGLGVLRDLGATDRARRAWCLHPLVQADDALAQTYAAGAVMTDDPRVLALAMEYRNIANACLSHRAVSSSDEIALGPLAEVADMLRADKVQNAKDFLLHHRGAHPRSDALERYFAHWLARLGVTRGAFARYFRELQCGEARPLPDGLSWPA